MKARTQLFRVAQPSSAGYSIVLIARDDAKLKATAEEVAALGPRAETYQLDFG